MMRFRELMDAHRKDLAKIITQEHGKTLADAEGEVTRGIEVIEFATGIPHLLKGEFSENVGTDVDSFSIRQPLGVCAGITPFNFPGDGAAVDVPGRHRMRQHVRAEAVGARSHAVDPHGRAAHRSRLARRRVQRRARRQGSRRWPARASAREGGVVRRAPRRSPSTSTRPARATASACRRWAAPRTMRSCCPTRTSPSPRRRSSARATAPQASAAWRSRRSSPSAKRRPAGRAARRARAPRVGRARATPPNIEMGPVITCAARDRIKGYIDGGVEAGATLVVDGRNPGIAGDGFFVGPTLFDRVEPSMAIYRDEIFGPVLSVVRVESLNDAIALINANPYANGTAIFTRSGHAARKFQQDIEVGMVGINVPIPVPMAFYSFGGWRVVAVRRPQRPRHGWRALLYAREDDHLEVARRRQRRAGVSHADDGVGQRLPRDMPLRDAFLKSDAALPAFVSWRARWRRRPRGSRTGARSGSGSASGCPRRGGSARRALRRRLPPRIPRSLRRRGFRRRCRRLSTIAQTATASSRPCASAASRIAGTTIFWSMRTGRSISAGNSFIWRVEVVAEAGAIRRGARPQPRCCQTPRAMRATTAAAPQAGRAPAREP